MRTGLGGLDIYRMLRAADNIASAAMWSVVHMTYARKVYTDGRSLAHADFKPTPEGHTGGSSCDASSLWQRGKERK